MCFSALWLTDTQKRGLISPQTMAVRKPSLKLSVFDHVRSCQPSTLNSKVWKKNMEVNQRSIPRRWLNNSIPHDREQTKHHPIRSVANVALFGLLTPKTKGQLESKSHIHTLYIYLYLCLYIYIHTYVYIYIMYYMNHVGCNCMTLYHIMIYYNILSL